ncbi:unnamed protein product [Cylindrotheca closterium]|uniref:Cytochrome P450 n=1 Tax=Cylindrotheca closterium TaxID=2856 RepID=A0AAD2CJS8_9STRA|nr:unnamed protein product [Cylindrotheca closterium]
MRRRISFHLFSLHFILLFISIHIEGWQPPLRQWWKQRQETSLVSKDTDTSSIPTRLPKAPKLDKLEYHPLIGILKHFQKDTAEALLELANYCRENDLPGVRLSAGIAGTFELITDPKLVEFVLSDKGQPNYKEGIFYKSALDRRGVGLLAGQGSLLSDGPDHTRKRRLILPGMDRSSLEGFLEIMETVSMEYSQSLTSNSTSTSTTQNVGELLSAIAMKIVGLALFSTNVVEKSIYNDIVVCLEHVVWYTRHPLAAPMWIPTRRNRKFRKALKRLDDLVYSLIENGQRQMQGSKEGGLGSKNDLLSMLLQARYDDGGGSKLDDKELRDEIMTLFLAGHETTAITLCWSLWYLGDPKHEHWQDIIVEEYDRIQNETGYTPGVVEDPEALKNTRSVLCEALRLRTPSYAFDREVQQKIIAPGNILWKRKALLMLSPLAMHLDPRYFDNPEEFDPSRFLEYKEGKDLWDGPYDRSVYLPFGAGRKRCIGYKFAQWESLVILGTLLKHVKVKRPEGATSVEWEPGVTLRPDRDLELVFEPREKRVDTGSISGKEESSIVD